MKTMLILFQFLLLLLLTCGPREVNSFRSMQYRFINTNHLFSANKVKQHGLLFSSRGSDLPPPPSDSKLMTTSNQASRLFKSIAVGFTAALLSASIAFGGDSQDALAANSGGRSGGSSFRSRSSSPSSRPSRPSSSTRIYSSGSYSYNSYSPMMPSPFFSPFSYGFGFGINPFGLFFNPNLLLLGGLAYVAYNIAKGRTGGTAFFNDQDTNSEVGSLGAGATVVKIQVCMDENWTDGNNIMSSLAKLANRNNNNMASSAQSDRATLSRMLSEVSMILLRKQSQWVSASIRGERFGGNILNAANDAKRAEPYFQKLAIQERSKFDKETIESRGYNPNEIVYDRNGNVMNGKSTPAVVSIIVAVRGKSDSLRSLTSTRDLADALQTLAAEASSDDGENVLAVEVLWTPSEPGEKMDMRSIIVDYPDLIEL